jgi:hypothetical protein
MRFYFVLFILLIETLPLWANQIGIQWPGWEILTSEKSSLCKYPLTNMIDGKPDTAWVFSKWGDYKPNGNIEYIKQMKAEFNHGIGTSITVKSGEDTTFICDGIQIINGYAKNSIIYQQNNRITKITLICSGPKIYWSKTYSLKETSKLQNLEIPHLRLKEIQIRFDEIEVGKYDDLCISELILYRDKKTIPWQLTPTVICNKELGCDASPNYILLQGSKKIKNYGDLINFVDIFPQPNNSNRVILFTPSNQLFLFDFKLNKYIWKQSFTGSAEKFGWQSQTCAYLQTYNERKGVHWSNWYILNTTDFSLKKIKAPPEKSRGFMRYVNIGC